MKKLSISILKVIIVFGFVIGLLTFTKSLAPERNETQKVYDDFVKELDHQNYSSTYLTPTSESEKELMVRPPVSLEFSIKEETGIKLLKYELTWKDASNSKKALRVLDLLGLANVFSQSSSSEIKNPEITIKVISPSGYKFESFLKAKDIEKNSSLNIALVLMRELASNA